MSTSDKYLKRAHETAIGIHPNTADSSRPTNGFVVTKSQVNEKKRLAKESGGNAGPDAIYEIEDEDVFGDGLSALGDIQVILRPEVSERTSYMRGDPMTSGGRPVSMNSTNREDVFDSIINADGPNKKSHMADAMINLLQSHLAKEKNTVNKSRKVGKGTEVSSYSNSVMHAEILGGYSIDDIEGIHYPFSKVQTVSSEINISDVTSGLVSESQLMMEKVTKEEASKILSELRSGRIQTPSSTALRDYRAAMSIRNKYINKGIGYVLFAHKKGINIDNPMSYDSKARRNETVEEVLKRLIRQEVISGAKKIVSDLNKEKLR